MLGNRDRLQTDAQIAAPDAALLQQLVRDPIERVDWNRKSGMARHGARGHAYQLAGRRDDRGSGLRGVEIHIQAQKAREASSAPSAPRPAYGAENPNASR